MRRIQQLLCLLALVVLPAWAADEHNYLVGRGMADVTGPALGVQLWGFGRPDQIGAGIHIRQHARAFVIAQRDAPEQRLAFVSADLGSIEHHLTMAVVEQLQSRYGQTYRLDNVIISATHTHACPGGYWHSRSDAGLDGGFYPEHFNALVESLASAIVAAHEDLAPGTIQINAGRVENAGVNRSRVAYLENPADERARYLEDTNKGMTLLKFTRDEGAIGLINWYALHPTAMNYYNRLISGDHKGYASLTMERALGAQPGDFVAAFAQADPGDVTPNTNLDNTGPGATDVETTQIMGERQLAVARELFDSATERLVGPLDTRQLYVDLRNYPVRDEFTGAGVQHTCPSAYGYSFAGGSTEDGGGHFLFYEGMTEQRAWRDWLIGVVTGAPKPTDAVRACQAPKPILFETGSGNPPLQSQVRSFTVARIGQLVLLAVPAEVTTMSGRRLRAGVMEAAGDWAEHIVLAGYANGFAGYITTPEEYQLQQYEAAHTLHGAWSLPAYQQISTQLTNALSSGGTITGTAVFDDWRGKAEGLALPRSAAAEPGVRQRLPGTALPLQRKAFRAGDTVRIDFSSTHPNDAFPRLTQYLQVQQKTASGWHTIADEDNWHTRIRWREDGDSYFAELSWVVPEKTNSGSYRMVHSGFNREGAAFEGASQEFTVK